MIPKGTEKNVIYANEHNSFTSQQFLNMYIYCILCIKMCEKLLYSNSILSILSIFCYSLLSNCSQQWLFLCKIFAQRFLVTDLNVYEDVTIIIQQVYCDSFQTSICVEMAVFECVTKAAHVSISVVVVAKPQGRRDVSNCQTKLPKSGGNRRRIQATWGTYAMAVCVNVVTDSSTPEELFQTPRQ